MPRAPRIGLWRVFCTQQKLHKHKKYNHTVSNRLFSEQIHNTGPPLKMHMISDPFGSRVDKRTRNNLYMQLIYLEARLAVDEKGVNEPARLVDDQKWPCIL